MINSLTRFLFCNRPDFGWGFEFPCFSWFRVEKHQERWKRPEEERHVGGKFHHTDHTKLSFTLWTQAGCVSCTIRLFSLFFQRYVRVESRVEARRFQRFASDNVHEFGNYLGFHVLQNNFTSHWRSEQQHLWTTSSEKKSKAFSDSDPNKHFTLSKLIISRKRGGRIQWFWRSLSHFRGHVCYSKHLRALRDSAYTICLTSRNANRLAASLFSGD